MTSEQAKIILGEKYRHLTDEEIEKLTISIGCFCDELLSLITNDFKNNEKLPSEYIEKLRNIRAC